MSFKNVNVSEKENNSEDDCYAEIYITEKSQLVYRCAFCISEYATFPHLIDHLNKYHQQNEDQSIEEDPLHVERSAEEEEEGVYELDEDDAYEGMCARLLIKPCSEELEFHCVYCNFRNLNYLFLMQHIFIEHYNSESYDSEQDVSKTIGLKALKDMLVKKTSKKLPDHIQEIKKTPARKVEQDKKRTAVLPVKRRIFTPDLEEENDFRIDREDKFYICNKCDRRFLTERKVREHLVSHRTERKYKCLHCASAFKDHKNYLVHIRRHEREPKYECSVCNYKFHTPSELNSHKRRHTGERIYMCTQCGKKYFTSSLLTAHLRRHNNSRPFECTKCMKKFYDGHKLKQHQATHDNKRAFKCDHCSASFNHRKSLVAHMKLHLNLREYVCDFCNQGFNQKQGLISHLKKHKKTQLTEMLDEVEEELHIVELEEV